MRKFVKKYVDACLKCMYYKHPSGRKEGMLHPVEKVPVPFHTLHIDHLGPFQTSTRGNKYLFVIVDGFTKFVVIEPVKDVTVRYVVKSLTSLMYLFGAPTRIISDRGTAFTSGTFKTFCASYGVKHVLNAVATPRANGQCERYNRTILSALAVTAAGDPESRWDKCVKQIQSSINCTSNKTIGVSPLEVLAGYKGRNIAEAQILSAVQTDLERLDLQELRHEVSRRIADDQKKQKDRFDKVRVEAKVYAEGDLLMVLKTDQPATGSSRKLLPKFKGPFRVVKVLPNDLYEVQDLREGARKYKTVIAVDKLKPWVILKVGRNQNKLKHNLPELQSVNRITSFPIVETGWNYAENIYQRIKKSNNLIFWTFGQAESSFYSVLDTALPAVILFEGPLQTIDKILCKSLDIVEQRVPIINLPPEMIYFNTKQYVSEMGTKIVRPVLKRADSVKQIGNSVLASKYTAFAADTLDGALNVADKYVDKYLPADGFDEQGVDEVDLSNKPDDPAGKAIQTIHHVDRFSRKLQRRLTRRTLAEAKALKEQSVEAIHVLVYVAELIATDPKLALQKGRELWSSLSKDEPENQARPENLEQLIVLLTRESARRVVHLVNFVNAGLLRMPSQVSQTFHAITNQCLQIANSVLKTTHLEQVSAFVLDDAKVRAERLTTLLKQLNVYAHDLLATLAQILSSQLSVSEQPKSSHAAPSVPKIVNQFNQVRGPLDTLHPPASPKAQFKASHRYMNNSNPPANASSVVNGVENA